MIYHISILRQLSILKHVALARQPRLVLRRECLVLWPPACRIDLSRQEAVIVPQLILIDDLLAALLLYPLLCLLEHTLHLVVLELKLLVL